MTYSDGHSIAVDQTKFKHSVHGSFSCVDCHTDVKSLAHDVPPKKITCDNCHADEGQGYAHSIHAQVTAAGKIPPPARIATATSTPSSPATIPNRLSIAPTFPSPAAAATAKNS